MYLTLKTRLKLVVLIVLLSFFSFGQNNRIYPPVIDDADVYTYKKVKEVDLKLWVYLPKKKQIKSTPVIVFFFGGGFRSGSPQQFTFQSKYFSSRGIASVVVDYRVSSRHGVKPIECVADAKDAIRWIRDHAKKLNINPSKIITSGGSAGGYLAAATFFMTTPQNKNIKLTDERPNALVLFNPGGMDLSQVSPEKFFNHFGAKKEEANIIALVQKNAPPTLILHGDNDKIVNVNTVRNFTRKMKALGNNCTLIEYKNQPHGFFNYGRGNNENYHHTMSAIDSFLREIDFLSPFPKTDRKRNEQ